MLYCTYDQYAAAGGTVPEAAFGVLCSRASRMIDAATFGRAESHAAGCEACRAALADACAQIVGLLAAASAAGAVPVLPASQTTATASPLAAMPV